MIVFYIIVFTLLGLIGLINSAYIFLNSKSFIHLPKLSKKNNSVDSLKYQGYTQMLLGLSFILYSLIIFSFNITNLLSHILFVIVAVIFVCIIGYLK